MKASRLLAVLVVVVVSLPPVACTRPFPIGELRSSPASTPVTPSESTDSVVQAAIQDVIQRANSEQEQAIAARDSSAMKDTSSDSYYRSMVRVNQELLDNGVTSIKLVRIEWGPITVTGERAQATTWESWATTSADGTTTQSRDRNVYRLVRQDGDWRIESDDHPDDILPPLPRGPVV